MFEQNKPSWCLLSAWMLLDRLLIFDWAWGQTMGGCGGDVRDERSERRQTLMFHFGDRFRNLMTIGENKCVFVHETRGPCTSVSCIDSKGRKVGQRLKVGERIMTTGGVCETLLKRLQWLREGICLWIQILSWCSCGCIQSLPHWKGFWSRACRTWRYICSSPTRVYV